MSEWVSEYDYPNRRVTLVLIETPEGRHWGKILKDPDRSQSDGNFEVFTSMSKDLVVKVVVALDDDGIPVAAPSNFNAQLIGPYTIWPYKYTSAEHLLWRSRGEIFN